VSQSRNPFVSRALIVNHIRQIAAVLAGTLVSASAPAFADRHVVCDRAVSTYELNICSDRAFQAADAKLNAAYAEALDVIRRSDQDKPYDPDAWEKALRVSQRAWVAFRDADCRDLVPMSWSGGTGTTSAVLGCMTTMTEARTKQLRTIARGA
jgi:uncharacterized protein YecT (DUF1311 family)